MNFYLALVARESGTQGNLRAYAFSTFFYSKLSKDGPTHTSWDRWMRRGNIMFFDYDLILIPIHQGNHWTLTVINLYFFFFLEIFHSFIYRQSIFVPVVLDIMIH